MLEGLNKIDWHSLDGADGPADDVPDLLKRLASDNDTVRQKALDELFGNLWHQGTIYEVTPFAVPFLIELLADEAVPGKDGILELLAELATGSSYWDAHQQLSLFADKRNEPGFQETLEEELGWVRNTRTSIYEGTELYLRLLHHNEAAVRTACAYLLACYPENATQSLPEIHQTFQIEEDGLAQSSMLMTIATLGKDQPQYLSLLLNALTTSQSGVVKIVSAMELARLTRDKAVPEVGNTLIEALDPPRELEAHYHQLPWVRVDITRDVVEHLRLVGSSRVHKAIQILTPFLGDMSRPGTLYLLLDLTFDERWEKLDITAKELTDEQKIVLSTIANRSDLWSPQTEAPMILRMFGLPDSQGELNNFLAGEL